MKGATLISKECDSCAFVQHQRGVGEGRLYPMQLSFLLKYYSDTCLLNCCPHYHVVRSFSNRWETRSGSMRVPEKQAKERQLACETLVWLGYDLVYRPLS
jgi:hypothetical protein